MGSHSLAHAFGLAPQKDCLDERDRYWEKGLLWLISELALYLPREAVGLDHPQGILGTWAKLLQTKVAGMGNHATSSLQLLQAPCARMLQCQKKLSFLVSSIGLRGPSRMKWRIILLWTKLGHLNFSNRKLSAILERCQQEPSYSMHEIERYLCRASWFLFSMAFPWYTSGHPDPESPNISPKSRSTKVFQIASVWLRAWRVLHVQPTAIMSSAWIANAHIFVLTDLVIPSQPHTVLNHAKSVNST